KKRPSSHRQIARGMDHQGSYGCRGYSNGRNVPVVPGTGTRRSRRPALLRKLGEAKWPIHLIMDRAYEGDETRQLALELNFIPVVPPKNNRVNPWEYDRAMYKRRNEIERLFRPHK